MVEERRYDRVVLAADGHESANVGAQSQELAHHSETTGKLYLHITSIHIQSISKEGRKEGNVLFNDALNTFYFRLYGVRHG